MFSTGISILGDAPDPVKLAANLAGHELLVVAGRGVANLLKEHFLGLNEERHGGYSTVGFYEAAADQVFGASDDAHDYGSSIGVGTAKVGIALRRFGAQPLLPRDKAYLAIPNYDYLSITHGRSPIEFYNLRILFGRQETGQIGPIGLIATEGGAKLEKNDHTPRIGTGEYTIGGTEKTKTTEGEVLFWLKKFVFMEADESVLPTDEELSYAGTRAAFLYLDRTPPPFKPVNETMMVS